MLDRTRKLSGAVRPYYGGQRTKARTHENVAPAGIEPPPLAPKASPSTEPRSAVSKRELKKAPLAPPDVVRQAAAAAGWSVMELGDDLQIDVATADRRSQIVSVSFGRRDREGQPLLVFASLCGPLDELNAAPLLRYNAKLNYGAFVVERNAAQEEMVVLRATVPWPVADAQALRRMIGEIAARADKVEGKLTGRDQF
jgi:hypothetical protein